MPYQENDELEKKVRYLNTFYSIDKENLVPDYTREQFVRKYVGYELDQIKDKLDCMIRKRTRDYQRRKNSWEYIMKGKKL